MEMAATSEVDAWKGLEETPAMCEAEAGVPGVAGKPVLQAFLRKQFCLPPKPQAVFHLCYQKWIVALWQESILDSFFKN